MNENEGMNAPDTEERIEIMLPILPGVGDYPWEGGLNGRFYRIKRGVKVCVPKAIAELINASEQARLESLASTMPYRQGQGKRLG